MFLDDLNKVIVDKAIDVGNTSISNIFLKFCKARGHTATQEHIRLAAGLEYLDFGVFTHYESAWTTKKVLSGDQYYSMGLKDIAQSGLDYVSSATITLMKITQAYANNLCNFKSYLDSFALWHNVPNFVSYLENEPVKPVEAEFFALNAALFKGNSYQIQIRSAIDDVDQNIHMLDITKVFES